MLLKERTKPVEILLIEDRRSDVILVEHALRELQIPYHLHVCEDGEQALAYLRHEGEYATAPRPDLILLDLTLPKKDGREVLAEIKDDPRVRHIPVIVLTDSNDEADVELSYRLHANSYIVKPPALDQLFQMVKAIEQFWLTVVTFFDGDEYTATVARGEPLEPNGAPPARPTKNG